MVLKLQVHCTCMQRFSESEKLLHLLYLCSKEGRKTCDAICMQMCFVLSVFVLWKRSLGLLSLSLLLQGTTLHMLQAFNKHIIWVQGWGKMRLAALGFLAFHKGVCWSPSFSIFKTAACWHVCESDGECPEYLGSWTHVGEPDGVSVLCLWSGSAPVIVSVWEVNQQKYFPVSSLSLL